MREHSTSPSSRSARRSAPNTCERSRTRSGACFPATPSPSASCAPTRTCSAWTGACWWTSSSDSIRTPRTRALQRGRLAARLPARARAPRRTRAPPAGPCRTDAPRSRCRGGGRGRRVRHPRRSAGRGGPRQRRARTPRRRHRTSKAPVGARSVDAADQSEHAGARLPDRLRDRPRPLRRLPEKGSGGGPDDQAKALARLSTMTSTSSSASPTATRA